MSNPEQTGGSTSYLLTDLWYCQRCDKGYVLSAFKHVTDSYNRRWIIKELAKSANPVSVKAASHTNVLPKVPAANSSNLKIHTIDYVIQDHETKCPNCKVELTKQSIDLKIVKGEHVEYIPCSALNCPSCRKWVLRRHHYIKLQTNHQPYIIELAHSAKPRSKPQPKKKRQSSSVKNPTPSVTRNNQFNKYGVFLPSPTGKTGYFDE